MEKDLLVDIEMLQYIYILQIYKTKLNSFLKKKNKKLEKALHHYKKNNMTFTL